MAAEYGGSVSIENSYDEGQLGRLREAALAEFGDALIHEAARLHRAVTGSRALGLGADAFAEVTAMHAEDRQ
jgi:hypothetical protein